MPNTKITSLGNAWPPVSSASSTPQLAHITSGLWSHVGHQLPGYGDLGNETRVEPARCTSILEMLLKVWAEFQSPHFKVEKGSPDEPTKILDIALYPK